MNAYQIREVDEEGILFENNKKTLWQEVEAIGKENASQIYWIAPPAQPEKKRFRGISYYLKSRNFQDDLTVLKINDFSDPKNFYSKAYQLITEAQKHPSVHIEYRDKTAGYVPVGTITPLRLDAELSWLRQGMHGKLKPRVGREIFAVGLLIAVSITLLFIKSHWPYN